jgi:hypothetical protein
MDFRFRTGPVTVVSVVAQSDSDSIGCRFVMDSVVKAETISYEVDTFTVCLLKAV